jgi:hypothetical protein
MGTREVRQIAYTALGIAGTFVVLIVGLPMVLWNKIRGRK